MRRAPPRTIEGHPTRHSCGAEDKECEGIEPWKESHKDFPRVGLLLDTQGGG